MADPADEGNWNEWRRVVLGDIRRVGEDVRHLDREVRALATSVALLTARAGDVIALEARVAELEAQRDAGIGKNEDRKWLIGLAILVVASIVSPAVRALIFGGGS